MKNEFEIISKIFKQVINNRSLCSLIAYLYCREYKYTACSDVTYKPDDQTFEKTPNKFSKIRLYSVDIILIIIYNSNCTRNCYGAVYLQLNNDKLVSVKS